MSDEVKIAFRNCADFTDEEVKKLEKYAAAYREQGDVNEFYDPRRPDWIPVMPLF